MRPILIANQFLIIACGQLPYFVLGSPLCLRRPAVWPFTLANHLCGHFSMWSITPANHFLWPFCGPFVAFLWPFSGGASVRPILLANDLCGPFSIVRPFFSSERLNDSREPAKLCLLGHIYFAYSQDAVHNHLHTKIYTTFQLSSSAAYCIWAPRLLGTLHPTQTGAEC
jgi:hypothetical protein